jgi:hypothetical protein
MKHFALRVAAIDDMIAEVAYRGAAVRGIIPFTSVNACESEKKNVPFFWCMAMESMLPVHGG